MKRIFNKLFVVVKMLLSPYGKTSFLNNLDHNAVIFDVGCGNNSPIKTKKIIPKCVYYGIDIDDYNQASSQYADHYITTTSENFSSKISEFKNYFDAVISSHNLEHCDDWKGVLLAIHSSLKTGGRVYISLPSELSITFPSRIGTLNFYDDSTHKNLIFFHDLQNYLDSLNFIIIYKTNQYKPLVLRIIGFILEPLSNYINKVLPGTWAYYGFEQIFLAIKK